MEGIDQIPVSNTLSITTSEFAAKFKSKREIYQLLTVDASSYLPNYDSITIYFLKDLIAGNKKCKCVFFLKLNCDLVIKNSNAIHLVDPQYKGLYFEDILQFAREHIIMGENLPDFREIAKLPKQWLINIAYSKLGDEFAQWVQE